MRIVFAIAVAPYALWKTYDHPGHAFHFHYPAPPWEKGEGDAFGLPVLVVDPELHPPPQSPGAKLRLEARMFVPADLDEVVAEANVGWHAIGYSTSPPTEFFSSAGDEGIQLRARSGEYWVKQIFHEDKGTVSMLLIRGSADPDDPDLLLLLDGFEPRPSGGS
jgi:hypothetical protein